MKSEIKNLRDLRERKAQIKSEMGGGFENPFDKVKGLLSRYTEEGENPVALFEKNNLGRNELMDEGVKAVLTLAASTAVTRFKLGPVPKLVLAGAVAIATPWIVDKIQDKFNKNKKQSK